jgi:putative toxin-antitoxin system antitoxin component (TIGR02293 family)
MVGEIQERQDDQAGDRSSLRELVIRNAQILAEADRVFGEPNKAFRWLHRPNPVLSGKAPIDLLASDAGSQAVAELLVQIDRGMFV